MRSWIAIIGCVVLLACAKEAERSERTVSVGEGHDGGYPDASSSYYPPSVQPGISNSGGGDGDGDGDDGSALNEQTEAQLDALCNDVIDAFESRLSRLELEELSCVYEAMLSVDYEDAGGVLIANRLQCQERVADCRTVTAGTSMLLCQSRAFRVAAMSCEGAAEDYLACAQDAARGYGDAVGILTCDNLATAGTVDGAFTASALLDPFAYERCREIASRCPELFGDATRGEPAEDGCDNTCSYKDDGWCDDGGPDAVTSRCPLGTDCLDCGERPTD